MNRIYKVIWNEALNCFTAVGEYAKASGKSSKSSVSANATINTTENLSSTSAFKLTAIGLGLMAAGFCMSPQAFAAQGVGNSISIGTANNCANNSTANTTNASSGLANSVAVGCNSVADLSTDPSITFYNRENPSNLPPVNFSTDTPFNSTAIGTNAKAYQAGTSIGMNASSRSLGIALGVQAKSDNVAAVAIGPAALATGNTSLALGRQSAATENFAQAIGNVASATGVGSLAMGHSAKAEGYRSIAIGSTDIVSARPTGNQPGVIYNPIGQTKAIGGDSIAFGSGAQAIGENAIALGRDAIAGQSGNVALGNSSITTAQHIGSFSINNLPVAGLTSGARTVSVGTVGAERQIQNVAPGVVDANSTDAINGSQLNATNNRVTTNTTNISNNTNAIAEGIKFNVNNSLQRTFALGEEIKFDTDSNLTTTALPNGDGIKLALADIVNVGSGATPVKIDGTARTISGLSNVTFNPATTYTGGQAATQEQLTAASGALTELGFKINADNGNEDNVKLGETVNFTNTDDNLVATVSDNGINYDLAPNITLTSVTISDGINDTTLTTDARGLSVNQSKIVDILDGNVTSTSQQAINGRQLFSTAQSIANNLGGGSVVNTDGTVSTPVYQVNGNDQTGVAGAIEELDKGFNLKTNGANISTVKAGDTIDIGTATGETNIEVVKTGNDIKFKLANNIDLNSVTTGNTVMDTGGITVTNLNRPDRTASLTSRGLTISNGPSVLRSGIDAGNKKITNVKAGSQPLDAVNYSQLETTNDAVNQGLNFTGDDTSDVINRQLGQTLTIKGGQDDPAELSNHANIGVVKQGQNLKIKLAKDINLGAEGSVKTGKTLVDNSGITIRNTVLAKTVSLTSAGLDNGGNQITNVASGGSLTEEADQNNAANIGDVKGAITGVTELGFGIKAADGNTVQKNLGEAVEIVGSNSNIDTQVNHFTGKVEVVLNNALNLTNTGSVTTGNTVMDTGGITVTNPNHSDRTASLTSRGLTISNGPSVLRSGIDAGNKKITNVKAGSTEFDAVNFGQLETTNDAVNRGLDFTGDNSAVTINRKSGEKLTVKGGATVLATGNNIGVVADNITNTLTVKLARDLTGLNSASFGNDVMISSTGLRAGTTVVNTSGVSFSNSTVSLSSGGLNNGGKRITGVLAGEISSSSTDAVNGSQLQEVMNSAENANKGWNISAAGGPVTTVAPGTAVDFNSKDSNITVSKNAESNDISFELNRDLDLDSATFGDVSISSANGLNNGGKTITNVGDGLIEVNSKDAINGGQLKQVISNIDNSTSIINEQMNAGLNFNADNSSVIINKKLGDSALSFNGGNNITTTSAGSSIKFDLNGNINVDSVTTGDTTVSTNGVVIAGGPSVTKAGIYAGNGETAPSMTAAGINAAGTKITNVADGMQPRDAVNFGQLDAVNRNLGNSINELGYRIGEVEDDANAGISAAMAMSSLPQAYIIGKSMIGGGIATYNGESAVAIGFSKLSADGRWVMKLNGTADTQGNVGAAIGAGFHFD